MTHTTTTYRLRTPERGVALLSALLFATTILAWTAAVLTSGVAAQQHQRYLGAASQAQDAAESGVNLLIAHLTGPESAALLASGKLAGNLRGTGDRAQRFDATLESAAVDGIDNDLDGWVDEDDEADMFEVTSTGRYDNVSRTVRVTLLARYRTPTMAAAAYIADPFADLRLNGNAFMITGYDIGLDGNPTGVVLPGIGVAGDPDQIENQIGNQDEDNVIGSGDDPSVEEVEYMELEALIDDGARAANVVLEGDGGTEQPESVGAWGTLDSPAVVFGSGDIHISGGAQGAGILIVDGNLRITGGFEWHGLVIVRGELVFAGGGGGKRIVGGLIVEKSVSNGNGDDDEITIGGTVDIMLSQETVQKVQKAFATYTLLNWREGPEPEATP